MLSYERGNEQFLKKTIRHFSYEQIKQQAGQNDSPIFVLIEDTMVQGEFDGWVTLCRHQKQCC